VFQRFYVCFDTCKKDSSLGVGDSLELMGASLRELAMGN
jgi:hypothetical protein